MALPKEKALPILFQPDMVLAILQDRKTQTRRIMKPQPRPVTTEAAGTFLEHKPCPYGRAGQMLYVREQARLSDDGTLVIFAADMSTRPITKKFMKWDHDMEIFNRFLEFSRNHPGRFRPSIFLPHWAARIILEVTTSRVERLQAITEEDAIAEGFSGLDEFQAKWGEINGRHSWRMNPYVWVITFSVVQR